MKRKKNRNHCYIYDFIKVKVIIGEHHHVLSRYLINRLLILCQIDRNDSVKIARDLKKAFVEKGMLEVSQ